MLCLQHSRVQWLLKQITLNKPWVRLVLAISIDGRLAPQNGGKANLGGEGDREVLEEALSWADGALVGAGTIRAHKSICLIKQTSLIQERLLQGKTKQPIALIVGSKILFSPDWLFFQQKIKRWMITNEGDEDTRFSHKGYDRLIKLKPSWEETLSNLYNEGLSKIVLLGGAVLASSLLEEDQVDELQLTITPRILGGSHTWISSTINNLPNDLTKKRAWLLHQVRPLKKDDLMISYYRNKDKV